MTEKYGVAAAKTSSGTETEESKHPFITFVEKPVPAYETDVICAREVVNSDLVRKSRGIRNVTPFGVAGNTCSVNAVREPDQPMSEADEVCRAADIVKELKLNLARFRGHLSTPAYQSPTLNIATAYGVAGEAPVMLIYAPARESKFWDLVLPAMAVYSAEVEKLCQEHSAAHPVRNTAMSRNAICRNGGIFAVTCPLMSRIVYYEVTKSRRM